MRIISGSKKGQRIIAPKNLPTRPTTDFAKESLFNILNNSYYFDDIELIDLFAGTGNISYEFASRGTKTITAVDQSFGCVKFITKTAKQLEFPITTIKSDVYKYLEKTSKKADIIFADPPYNFSEAEFLKIVNLVFDRQLLKDDGYLIIEHSKHTDLSTNNHFSYHRGYGGSVFSFFE